MDFLPIYYRPMMSQTTPLRDMLTLMLHDELGTGLPVRNKRPDAEKWRKTVRLDNFHPDEIKFAVNDNCVRILARHVRGDDDNGDVRESKRCIQIPDGVDESKIHCYMNDEHHYTVEAPFMPRKDEEEIDVKVEDAPAITEGEEAKGDVVMADGEDGPFKTKLDLSVFDPDHINVKRRKNTVTITADHSRDEDGIKVSRSFRKEFTIPDEMDYSQVKCNRGADGSLTIMAPRREK